MVRMITNINYQFKYHYYLSALSNYSSDMQTEKTQNNTQELKPPNQWGKLISKSKGTSDYELNEDTITIGRKPTNLLVINDQALSSNHCVIYKDADKIMLKDLSTNGTYLNNTKIGQGNQVELQHNNQIWLLHPSRVSIDKTLGYVFEWTQKKQQQEEKKAKQSKTKEDLKRKVEELALQQDQLKKKTEQEIKKLEEERNKAQQQKDQMNKTLKEQITCSICLEIMHVPVAVHPCNHHFCGGCLTSLVQSKQQNCAQCRKQITTGQRDATFNVIIEQYLKNHPDEKRSAQEIADLDKNNIFTFDTADIQQLIHGKKVAQSARRGRPVASRAPRGRAARRRGSDLSASDSSDDDDGRCRECAISRNGFQCGPSQVHVNCHACGKLMARRDDPALHQSCILCDQFYCNLYYPPCTPVGVKLMTVNQHGPKSKVTIQNFRGNSIELSYFNDFLRLKKMTAAQLFQAIATKYIDTSNFKFLYDRKVMKIAPVVNREVPVTRDSAICTMCWSDLWFQLVLKYRMDINNELPPGVGNRVPCYYGINCSTMGHKADHAKKLNHCGYQTKF